MKYCQRSSLLLPVCGREGQGQDSLAAHFVLRNAASSVSEKSESGNASLRLGRGGIPPPNPLLPPRPRSDCPFFRRNWRPCQFHWRAAQILI